MDPHNSTLAEMAATANIDDALLAELLDWATGRDGAEHAEAIAKHELAHLITARSTGLRLHVQQDLPAEQGCRPVTKTYDHDLDYLFDGAIAERVVGLLTALGVEATVEEYEPGMHQVRLDPSDRRTRHGWVAVAGQGEDMNLGWFLIETSRDTDGRYTTTDGYTPISLGLPISAEPAQVATAIMTFLAGRA